MTKRTLTEQELNLLAGIKNNNVVQIRTSVDNGASKDIRYPSDDQAWHLFAQDSYLDAMHLAVKYDRVEAARCLLELGFLTTAKNAKGYLPAEVAAKNKQWAMVKLFIEREEDLSAYGRVLFYAVEARQLDLVATLLTKKAPANYRLPDGRESGKSILHVAEQHRCYEAMALLLSYGASVLLPDDQGETVFYYARVEHRPDSLTFLQEYQQAQADLTKAIRYGNIESVQDLVKQELAIGETTLSVTINLSHYQSLDDGKTWVHLLADLADDPTAQAIYQVLSEQGTYYHNPLHCEGQSGLNYAARLQKWWLVKACSEKIAKEDTLRGSYNTAMIYAAYYGECATMGYLLSRNADVNFANAQGDTALHCAAARGYDQAVQVLLDWNANVELKNCQGLLPIDLAIQHSHPACVKQFPFPHRYEVLKRLIGQNAADSTTAAIFLLDGLQVAGLFSQENKPRVELLLLAAAQVNNLLVIHILQSMRSNIGFADDQIVVNQGELLYQCLTDCTMPIQVGKILAKHDGNKEAVQQYIQTLPDAEAIFSAMKKQVRKSQRWFAARPVGPEDATTRLVAFFAEHKQEGLPARLMNTGSINVILTQPPGLAVAQLISCLADARICEPADGGSSPALVTAQIVGSNSL